MTMTPIQTVEQSLLETLVNALLAEDVLDSEAMTGGTGAEAPALKALAEEVPAFRRAVGEGVRLWSMPLDGRTWLVMPVRPEVCQAQVLVPDTPVVAG